jgi:hypothetical protein
MVDATNQNNEMPLPPSPSSSDGRQEADPFLVITQLGYVLGEPLLRGLPLLIFANKMDRSSEVKTMLSIKDIAIRLGLPGISNRRWHIQGCVATTGMYMYALCCIYVSICFCLCTTKRYNRWYPMSIGDGIMAGLEWLGKEIIAQTNVEQKNHSLSLNNQPLTSLSPPIYPIPIQTFAPLYPPPSLQPPSPLPSASTTSTLPFTTTISTLAGIPLSSWSSLVSSVDVNK